MKGEPAPDPASIKRDVIDNSMIYDCIAEPHPSDVETIKNTLLSTPDITSCLNTINTLKASRGLALADILTALGNQLSDLDVPVQTRISWLEGLAEIEYRLSGGGSETVQTGAVVGVVRNGVELMEHSANGA